ncbi:MULTISPECIES: hypothetical protein [unclassified Frondihabitans]|uniref:hypothetical protein n=1 Tax=unclassified Frondihabitans TaxID=2626248 RepID=UPI000F4ECA0B|nr:MULTISPECIES: hypothetical protein [unclassified Frondihabitans]RPE78566.1 hypothetical protein EDF37_1245 [Frondihabitans sp. PhB153]RPF08847.1 hypothetical protein EDF39_1247 [Frondihabitans sp. PhB161]
MTRAVLEASIISTRLSLLAQLDSSAGVSFMNRAELRLRIFGVVDALDRGVITADKARELFARVQGDISTLIAADQR